MVKDGKKAFKKEKNNENPCSCQFYKPESIS